LKKEKRQGEDIRIGTDKEGRMMGEKGNSKKEEIKKGEGGRKQWEEGNKYSKRKRDKGRKKE